MKRQIHGNSYERRRGRRGKAGSGNGRSVDSFRIRRRIKKDKDVLRKVVAVEGEEGEKEKEKEQINSKRR